MNENTNPDVKTIENATGDDVRPGDHITWEESKESEGVTVFERREGIAHRRDSEGDWWAKGSSLCITFGEGEGITLKIRPAAQDGEDAA